MINYVIGAWAGTRRVKNKHYDADRAYYLKEHLGQLEKLKHNIDQITIVVADNNEGKRPEFDEYIDSIRGKYVVVERKNGGQSYGSWSHAYDLYRDKFDYYIFVEDDYVFMLDDFDSLLVENFESKENCGYLCSMVSDYAHKFNALKHASISNGICSAEALGKVWDRFGQLPHQYFYEIANSEVDIYDKFNSVTNGHGSFVLSMFTEGFSIKRICKKLNVEKITPPSGAGWNYVMFKKILEDFGIDYLPRPNINRDKYSHVPQVYFSQAFYVCGYEVYDFADEYYVPFKQYSRGFGSEFESWYNITVGYGNQEGLCLIAPIQYLERRNKGWG